MPEFLQTGDGSFTLYKSDLDETYHSRHGAITESNHVFLQNGLLHIANSISSTINILEVGLGTALNAYLTLKLSLEKKISVNYISLEPFPIQDFLLKNPQSLNSDWENVLKVKNGEIYNPHQFFKFEWQQIGLLDFSTKDKFHCIYFDAFAPQKQPDLWTLEVFERLHSMLEIGGILVTYCAQGAFKRNLKTAGFRVEALPGPPGKREMTRAIKL